MSNLWFSYFLTMYQEVANLVAIVLNLMGL
jgi:hypothetical protein